MKKTPDTYQQAASSVSSNIAQFVDQSATDAVMAPLAEAKGLPNIAFTSQGFFDLEQEKLMSCSWQLAGFDRDVPDVGDVQPVNIAGVPLLLVRDKSGEVSVFHNACRHRGARLVNERCSGNNRLICPYHRWTYELTGQLVARPYFAGSSPKDQALPASEDLNLVKVRQARWLDMVFVNLSGGAPEFAASIKPMTDKLSSYDLTALKFAGQIDFEVASNWKFACENYMENYHVFAAHPKLVKFSPMKGRSPGRWDGSCFSTGYEVENLESGRGEDLPHFPGLTPEMSRHGMWFLLFPNFAVEVFADQFAIFRFIPVAPNQTREEIHLYLIGDAATSDHYKDARNIVLKTWHDLNLEDIGVLERLQAGRSSPSYTGGVYSSHWESPCHQFSRQVVQMLM